MIEFLNWYNDFAKENPIVASAFGVGLGGWMLMLARGVPARVYNFTKSRLITTLVMNNSGSNGYTSILFMKWFNEKSGWGRLSRNLALEVRNDDHEKLDFASGFGLNFFIYNRHLFWFRKVKLDSAGTYHEKFEITLSMLGRDQNVLKSLVEEFRYRPDKDKIMVNIFQHNWHEQHAIRKRKRSSVILNSNVEKQIFNKIDDFIRDKDWYHDRGLPYKLCFLFTGPPGTGKTSLSKVIGSEYDRNIYSLSLANMTDDKLRKAVLDVPKGNIIQLEDLESNSAVQSRELKPLSEKERNDLDQLIKQYGVSFLTVDDLTPEVVSAIMSGGLDVERLSIAVFEDDPGRIYYWDKYHEDVQPHTCEFEIGPHETAGMVYERFNIVQELGQLHNRANGGNNAEGRTGALSLSGVLNALDGIIPLDDQIIILTSNHPEKLDAALVRKGRVDHIVKLGELHNEEIRNYIGVMFPGHPIPTDKVFKPTAGCNLQAIFYEHKFDPDAFINAIPVE